MLENNTRTQCHKSAIILSHDGPSFKGSDYYRTNFMTQKKYFYAFFGEVGNDPTVTWMVTFDSSRCFVCFLCSTRGLPDFSWIIADNSAWLYAPEQRIEISGMQKKTNMVLEAQCFGRKNAYRLFFSWFWVYATRLREPIEQIRREWLRK